MRGLGGGEVADGGDAPAIDRKVCGIPRQAGPIDDVLVSLDWNTQHQVPASSDAFIYDMTPDDVTRPTKMSTTTKSQ